MNDAAKEDAFESMRHQLKGMEQALKAAQGVARVQRTKRLRAEAQLEGVVESMKRMAEEIKCRGVPALVLLVLSSHDCLLTV